MTVTIPCLLLCTWIFSSAKKHSCFGPFPLSICIFSKILQEKVFFKFSNLSYLVLFFQLLTAGLFSSSALKDTFSSSKSWFLPIGCYSKLGLGSSLRGGARPNHFWESGVPMKNHFWTPAKWYTLGGYPSQPHMTKKNHHGALKVSKNELTFWLCLRKFRKSS